jgi:sigma-B regulation protein RsbU (phosphoserine phosphatase)
MLAGRRAETGLAASAAIVLAGWWAPLPLPLWLGAICAALILGGVLGVKYGARLLRKAIWRLRNRLIVAYVFIAVIPIVLLLGLVRFGSRYLGEQISVHLVHSELDRRTRSLQTAAESVARAEGRNRAAAVERIQGLLEPRFPGIRFSIEGNPAGAAGNGLGLRSGRIYAWGRSVSRDAAVTVTAPLSRAWLSGLIPGLGDVTLLDESGNRFRSPESNGEEAAPVPPAVNRFDLELLWGVYLPVTDHDTETIGQALLSVRSRLSRVLDIVFTQQTVSPLMDVLKFLGATFLLVQVLSIVLGVSLTRTITSAVNELYEGTQHIVSGDLAHRIPVKGDDQLAQLGRSFNRMTAHLEELIQVAKEKERIDTELEIARGVQAKLFPKTMPRGETMSVFGACHPARSVSGDYYDCQRLSDSRLAIALGDVAGKGISAALLMALLQASLRSQIRDVEDWPGALAMPSRLVTKLNQQLYETTSQEKYATFFLGIFQEATGTLTYCNAGHLPPILIRDGAAHPLEVTGTVVGLLPAAVYEERQIQLAPGDVLLAYTDGVTEAENEFGEMFGDRRLTEIVLGAAGLDSARIAEAVTEAVRKFTGSAELQDDLTILIARRDAV